MVADHNPAVQIPHKAADGIHVERNQVEKRTAAEDIHQSVICPVVDSLTVLNPADHSLAELNLGEHIPVWLNPAVHNLPGLSLVEHIQAGMMLVVHIQVGMLVAHILVEPMAAAHKQAEMLPAAHNQVEKMPAAHNWDEMLPAAQSQAVGFPVEDSQMQQVTAGYTPAEKELEALVLVWILAVKKPVAVHSPVKHPVEEYLLVEVQIVEPLGHHKPGYCNLAVHILAVDLLVAHILPVHNLVESNPAVHMSLLVHILQPVAAHNHSFHCSELQLPGPAVHSNHNLHFAEVAEPVQVAFDPTQ